jgi:hypothetical protein
LLQISTALLLFVDWSFGSLLWQPPSGDLFLCGVESLLLRGRHYSATLGSFFGDIFCVERDGQLFTVDLLFLLLLLANVVLAIVFSKPQRLC